jgi:penicillin amidase
MQVLQTDTVSMPARRLCALLAALPGRDPARDLFAGWDHRLDADSAPAALVELWWTKHLKPALMARLVPDAALRKLLVPGDIEALLRALEQPDVRFGDDPVAARDRMLLDTLGSAHADCAARMGSDSSAWAWGRLHHAAFTHPLAAAADVPGAWHVAPLPMGGSSSTPMHTGYRPSDFRVMHGASFRMVVDLANTDGGVTVNSPGQSGDPRSPHYQDLAPIWARGAYVPMLYTAEAVAEAAESVIEVMPGSKDL